MISQTYDLDANALYIELADQKAARTIQIDAGTLVDLDSAGKVIGIEVIRPGRTWQLEEIIARFGISGEQADELRAYFPYAIVQLEPPLHPAQPVPVRPVLVS